MRKRKRNREREEEEVIDSFLTIRIHIHSYLSVFLILLVVEVCFEGKFGSTDMTLETSFVEEGEIFEWSNLVHGIDGVATSQTLILIWHGIEPFTDGHILCSWCSHGDSTCDASPSNPMIRSWCVIRPCGQENDQKVDEGAPFARPRIVSTGVSVSLSPLPHLIQVLSAHLTSYSCCLSCSSSIPSHRSFSPFAYWIRAA